MREAPIRLGIITLSPSVTNSCPDPILFICLHHCRQRVHHVIVVSSRAFAICSSRHKVRIDRGNKLRCRVGSF